MRSTMTMIRVGAAVTSAIVVALWYKQSTQTKPKKHPIHGSIGYNTVSDDYELRIAGDGPTRITDVTHTGLECMSNAGYKVRTYAPTNISEYTIPVILASPTWRTQGTFAEDCMRCRVRSGIHYMTATHKHATTTIHWDEIVRPDKAAHQAYTDVLPLTH